MIMSIGKTTLVRSSVRSLLTAAGLAGGLFALPVLAWGQTAAGSNDSSGPRVVEASSSSQLEQAVTLMAAGKVVQAKAILMGLNSRASATGLSDVERAKASILLTNVNRRIRAMNPIDVSLQTAEDSLAHGDVRTVESHARAVIASPMATNAQTAAAKVFMAKAVTVKSQLAPTVGKNVDAIHADFEAGRFADAKAAIDRLNRSGVELNADQEQLVNGLQLKLVAMEDASGPIAAAGMMQPGVIKPVEGQPATQPPGEPPAHPASPPPAAPDAAAPAPAPASDPIEQARRWEVQGQITKADQAFEQQLMKSAAEQYQTILSGKGDVLTPQEKTHIENRLAEAKVRMGVNVGGEGQPIENYMMGLKVKHDHAVAEFNNYIEQARRAMDGGDMAGARRLADDARVAITSVDDVFNETEREGYLRTAAELSAAIDKRKLELDMTTKATQAKDIEKAAFEARSKSSQDKSRKINEAIDRVRALQQEMKYTEALQVIDQILFLDPINPTGLVLRDAISDTRTYQTGLALENSKNRKIATQQLDNMGALLSPDEIITYPSDWPGISYRRGEPLGMSESEVDRGALAVLEKKRIPVNFPETSLASVVSFLNAVTQLNFDVDWAKLQEAGIDKETPITLNLTNVPVKTVLERVLEKASKDSANGAWYAINDGVVSISTRDDINKKKTLQIYDIRDLLIEVPNYTNAPDFDLSSVLQSSGQGGGGGGQSPFRDKGDQTAANRRTLQERTTELLTIITTNVDEQGWQENGGDVGFIQQLTGSLIITNTPANHRAINGLLSKLRQIRAMQINVEARFLLVQTDFFEQIGFDLDVYFNGRNNQVQAARAGIPNGAVQPSDFFDFSRGGLQRRVFGALTDANGDGTPDPTVGLATANPGPLSVIGAGQNSLGQTESLASGNFAQGILSRAPALGVGGQFLDDIQVDFLVKATQSDRRTVTLTAPRLTFTNGQIANMYVATQVAFVSDLQPVVGDSAVAFDPTLATVNEGVRLVIEGTISADRRYVTMNVDTSVAKIIGFQNTAITAIAGGLAVNSAATQSFIQRPTTTVTRVQTTVTVPDQGTILLGGQRLVSQQEVESGVPVLSKIPIINRFFSNRIEVREEQTLLILIKPTVLIQNEEEERFFPGLAESVKFPG